MKKYFSAIGAVMFCSAIYAQIWQPLGPFGSEKYNLKNSAWGGGTGQINAFAFVAADDKSKYDWYCASPVGGLWKSTDEGHHWVDMNPALQDIAGVCSTKDIAVDPRIPNTFYIANGTIDKSNKIDAPCTPSTGVFMTRDGGISFEPTGLKFNYEDNDHIRRLVANKLAPDNVLQLFAATDGGLYMNQTDVKKKWTKVLDNDKIFTVEISPDFAVNKTVYASGDDIFISKKEGTKNSFHPMNPSITDLLPPLREERNINLAVASKHGVDVIYALVFQDRANYFLYYDGAKWEKRTLPLVTGMYIPSRDRIQLVVNPADPDNIYAGMTYVTRSDDGGKTWALAGKYCQPGTQNDPLNIHGDIHALAFIPHTTDVMIGTDGGVFRYMAEEKMDIDLNVGLNISQIVGMRAPTHAPHKILIGKQDTGYDIYEGGQWLNFAGGDGCFVHASPVDTALFLCNYGRIFQAKDKIPATIQLPSCKAREDALFQVVAFDPKAGDRCFVGGTNLSYTGDGAKTFTTIYKYHTGGGQPVDFDSQIESMAAGHSDMTGESVIYATNFGFYGGVICKMAKGKMMPPAASGKSCDENLCSTCWNKVTLPNEKFEWPENSAYSVSGIAVSTDDPDELWICYDHVYERKDDLKVSHSADGGASWDDMNKGLPRYTVCTAILYDDKTKFLYLGTSRGIYINKNDGSGWKIFGEGLPKCHVKAMEIQPGIGKLRAGLYGRGVWEADLAVN